MKPMKYLNELFDYELYVSAVKPYAEEHPRSNIWLPPKSSKGILCKIGSSSSGRCSAINKEDREELNVLTGKHLSEHPDTDWIHLRRDSIFLEEQFGLSIVLVPHYADFCMYLRYDLPPLQIDGKQISAIAFGDNTKFSIIIPNATIRTVLTMNVLKY